MSELWDSEFFLVGPMLSEFGKVLLEETNEYFSEFLKRKREERDTKNKKFMEKKNSTKLCWDAKEQRETITEHEAKFEKVFRSSKVKFCFFQRKVLGSVFVEFNLTHKKVRSSFIMDSCTFILFLTRFLNTTKGSCLSWNDHKKIFCFFYDG
jgi:hypothetical protein